QVLRCDNQNLNRFRVRGMLHQDPAVHIVGEAADGRTAVKLALELRPHIIIMDISMPGLDGIAATRQIVNQAPEIRILGFSTDSDEETIRKMFAAGACGYVCKLADPAELVVALTKILSGERFLSLESHHDWPRLD